MTFDTELLTLANGLSRDCKRRQDQYRLVGVTCDVLCPGQLHCGFAKPAICEDRGSALAERPCGERLLKGKQLRRHPKRLKAVISASVELALQELGVIHHPTPRMCRSTMSRIGWPTIGGRGTQRDGSQPVPVH